MQDFLRVQVKLAKVYNDDWSYKDFAEVIDITAHSFYNWLNGYYELSEQKRMQLQSIVNDLLDSWFAEKLGQKGKINRAVFSRISGKAKPLLLKNGDIAIGTIK